jgi:putative transposase
MLRGAVAQPPLALAEFGKHLKGDEVVEVVDRLLEDRGAPDRMQCDNGSGFVSKVLDKRAARTG